MFSGSNFTYSLPALTEQACLGVQRRSILFLLLRSSQP